MAVKTKSVGYATKGERAPLERFEFERRELRPRDIKIDILYCGICHSDLHQAKNEWKNTVYPLVPGHEIVGRISEVGSEVKGFKVGELAAVGCMADSCRTCPSCREHLEQYCDQVPIFTYNGKDRFDGTINKGGYSNNIVIDQDFVLHLPKEFQEKDLARVAPLLCAGITTYSPLKKWNVGPGSRVAIVGLGGLGHVALKIAHALGAHVILLTSSESKTKEAKRLGADEVVVWKKEEELKKYANSLDFILDTASVKHNLDPFISLLKRDGTLCLIGAPAEPHPSPNIQNLIFKRRSLAGTLIGGIRETQEMLDFCAKHKVLADIELIPAEKINEAYERLVRSDVKYRFVIDLATLNKTL